MNQPTKGMGAPLQPAPIPVRLDVIAVELWRMKTRLARVSGLLPAKEARPLENCVQRMEEVLLEARISVDDPSGRPYVEGQRMEVLLFESVPEIERPTIVQTVKPAVLVDGIIVRPAEVIVATPGASSESAT